MAAGLLSIPGELRNLIFGYAETRVCFFQICHGTVIPWTHSSHKPAKGSRPDHRIGRYLDTIPRYTCHPLTQVCRKLRTEFISYHKDGGRLEKVWSMLFATVVNYDFNEVLDFLQRHPCPDESHLMIQHHIDPDVTYKVENLVAWVNAGGSHVSSKTTTDGFPWTRFFFFGYTIHIHLGRDTEPHADEASCSLAAEWLDQALGDERMGQCEAMRELLRGHVRDDRRAREPMLPKKPPKRKWLDDDDLEVSSSAPNVNSENVVQPSESAVAVRGEHRDVESKPKDWRMEYLWRRMEMLKIE